MMSDFTIEFGASKPLTKELLNALYGGTRERPAVLSICQPVYEHESSRYPDTIRLSFMDGHTEIYEIRAKQPHPIITENIRIIRKWKQGYVNQPARRRRK